MTGLKGFGFDLFIGLLGLLPLLLAIILMGASRKETYDIRQQAVDRGYAEWHEVDNKKQFKWKEKVSE